MNARTPGPKVEVTADGEALVSHAGAYLLFELADRLGLTEALSGAMAPTRERRSAHDPGRVLCDAYRLDRPSDMVLRLIDEIDNDEAG